MSVGRAKCVSSLPGDLGVPSCHHQLLAIARELVDGMRAVVHQPDVPLGVVRVHQHAVRPHEQLVVLLPRLDQLAVAIDDVDDVIPARVPRRILLRQVVARGVARRDEGRPRLGSSFSSGRQPAAEDEHAIGALRPDACRRSDDVSSRRSSSAASRRRHHTGRSRRRRPSPAALAPDRHPSRGKRVPQLRPRCFSSRCPPHRR